MYKIEDITNKILLGDCLEELKKMPNECVDMVITSPPYYGLRNYGVDGQIGLEDTFQEFLDKIMLIMAELKRVVKKEGSLWINFGDCFSGERWSNSAGTGIWSEGKSIIKANIKAKRGFIQATDNERMFSGQYNNNRLKQTATSKCLLLQPERFAIRCVDELGLLLRNDIIWAKQVLLKKENITKGSVMPTSVQDRFNMTHEHLFFFTKQKKYYSDLNAVRIAPQSKLNYEQKRVSGMERLRTKNYNKVKLVNGGAIGSTQRIRGFFDEFGGGNNPAGKNIGDVWLIGSEPHSFQKEYGPEIEVDHFAVFPEKLPDIPIRFACPKGGLILDPFGGSLTTCVVAKKLGRNYLAIELNEKYIKIGEKRLKTIQDRLI